MSNEDEKGLEIAKELITAFYEKEEYEELPDFSDLKNVPIASTDHTFGEGLSSDEILETYGITDPKREFSVKVNIDLISKCLETYLEGDLVEQLSFSSYEEMNEVLSWMEFSSLTSLDEDTWQVLANRLLNAEAEREIDKYEEENGADGRRFLSSQALIAM